MSFDRIAVLTLIVSIQSSLFDIVQPSTGSCGRCNDAYGVKAGIRVTINAQVCVSYAQKNKKVARFFGKVCRRRKVATSKETGSGRPHPEIIAIIMACPSSCRFDTLRVVSTQNCLFDDET